MIIKKGNWKMLITGGKKEKCGNLDTHEKELLKNYLKKGKRKLRAIGAVWLIHLFLQHQHSK